MARAKHLVGGVYRYPADLAEWFLCIDNHPVWPGEQVLVCVQSPHKSRKWYGYSCGHKDVLVDDPSRWPPDVCKAVAQWKLTGSLHYATR